MQGVWVGVLVREIGSRTLCRVAKKNFSLKKKELLSVTVGSKNTERKVSSLMGASYLLRLGRGLIRKDRSLDALEHVVGFSSLQLYKVRTGVLGH